MIKVGIIGCGHIARTMADTLSGMETANLVAVASKDRTRAENFAKEFGVEKAYGSYKELFEDEEVELVYVATLMSQHKDNMLEAISYGKPVLCEKSFTVNTEEAEEVFKAAKEKGVYVAEAIWTRYMPVVSYIRNFISSGRLGNIRTITANLAYPIAEKERIRDPKLGGGVMLDITVYPLNFALMFLEGQKILYQSGSCAKNEFGADIRESLTIVTDKGVCCSLMADGDTLSDRKGMIYFDRGRIEVENINNPETVRVYTLDPGSRKLSLIEEKAFRHRCNGFEYEVEAAERAIRQGKLEPDEMPWSETLRVMELMDTFRQSWGVQLGSELS